jgi:stage II sporulation protein AA (anti-sigma F factor antagonist)
MEPVSLTVSTDLVDGLAVVTVAGDVDLASADRLGDELETALHKAQTLVVDVGGVTFIDSTGLNVLVQAHRTAQEGGGDLRIRRPSKMLTRLLEITRLETLFVVDEDGPSSASPDQAP